VFALACVGLLARRQGALHKAIPVLERGLALCQTANIPHLFPQTASILGTVYVLAARAAEAYRSWIRPWSAWPPEPVSQPSSVLTELSQALLLVGRVDEARALAGRLLEISRTDTGRGYQAHAYRFLGEVGGVASPRTSTNRHPLRQALALAEALGMRPLVAHCHYDLGTCMPRPASGSRLGPRVYSYGDVTVPWT